MEERRAVAERAVFTWRDKLVNLTGRNRLLNFTETKSSTVSITEPPLGDVLSRLSMHDSLEIVALREEPADVADDGLASEKEQPPLTPSEKVDRTTSTLGANHDPAVLSAALRNLLTKTNQTLLDTGLWTLYLALGTLTWSEPDDPSTSYRSPIILWPVSLRRPGRRMAPVVALSLEDAVVNPALVLKMATLDLEFPAFADITSGNVEAYLEEVADLARGREGWKVGSEVAMSYFTFHKEAMYRDLQENIDDVLASDLVMALATSGLPGQTEDLLFDAVGDGQIDAADPPEAAMQVLNADASQRAAILAAVDGQSFVLDGPPGTGKSQTIANIIASLIPRGETVLFVSEKVAALEVVKNRLDDVGLGHYVLELHSSKATRKEVASELSAAVQFKPRATSRFSDADRQRLKQSRKGLSKYAAAMNRVREPLGMSLHDAIGIVSRHEGLPATSHCQGEFSALSSSNLATIAQESAALGRAWRPALHGSGFLWRAAASREPLSDALQSATYKFQDLRVILSPYMDLAEALGLERPSDAGAVLEILRLWHVRPGDTPLSWLSATSPEQYIGEAKTAHRLVGLVRSARDSAERSAGPQWRRLDGLADGHTLHRVQSAAEALKPAFAGMSAMGSRELDALVELLGRVAELVDQLGTLGGQLAQGLGLVAPNGLPDVQAAITIEGLSRAAHRPERDWLRVGAAAVVGDALAGLSAANTAVTSARSDSITYFREAVLELDPLALQSRFANVHRGLGRFSAAYRADARSLGEASAPGFSGKKNIRNLHYAVRYQEALAHRSQLESQYAAVLGPRYRQEATDWNDLSQALGNARAIADAARIGDLDSLQDALSRGTQPHPELAEIRDRVSADLAELRECLAPAPFGSAAKALIDKPLPDQQAWSRSALALATEAQATVAMANDALGSDFTLQKVKGAWASVAAVLVAERDLENAGPSLRSTLEGSFTGVDTDLAALDRAVAWTVSMRAAVADSKSASVSNASPIPTGTLDLLLDSEFPGGLEQAIEAWQPAIDRVAAGFESPRRHEIAKELDTWSDGEGLLADLLADSTGQEEWFAHSDARDVLDTYGLGPVVVSAADLRLPGSDVPDVLMRETLRRWSDRELAGDTNLRTGLARDRDALVSEFQSLDSQLVQSAVADVIERTNAFRPTSMAGQAGLLISEGQKKARHRPIRELLSATRDATQKVKPVFMMSPLSVSQYLASDMRFDVVIFDEASQVMPEDAVNCVYRGDRMIIAGDVNQLPPTNFFALAEPEAGDWDDDESSAQDFESILSIAKGSGALTSLTLNWHYRSRHEDLIAFSNRRFYGGNLITFPSSEAEGAHVGVAFFHVPDGVYERGGSRRNMVEARFVAGRVEHHFDTRPHMSMGVVAFSQQQADAIDFALDELVLRRPDLEGNLGGTRLDGFFVKNLESVQGDERDVMVFSLGYGSDESGKFTMNFGPINRAGGWRRLNVAVTRARHRNEVVASFLPGQITAGVSRSVQELKAYMDYAARGIEALELSSDGSMGDAESPFEESVVTWLRSEGYLITTQVGSSGYRIDMAVQDPAQPSRYVLGIECDGAAYHSSQAARDRDRLRQEVLTGLGWRLHRIWGTAWYHHRGEEQERLRGVIDAALRGQSHGLLGDGQASRESGPGIELDEVSLDRIADWAQPYIAASPSGPPRGIEITQPAALVHLRATIEAVVEAESPVHIEIVHARIRESWGIGRIGSNIRDQVDKAIRKSAAVKRDDDFLHDGTLADAVMTRTHDESTKREIRHIHRREIEDTAHRITDDRAAISLTDLVVTTARYLGFARVGADVNEAIIRAIRTLQASGWLTDDDDNRIRAAAIE